MRKIMIVVLSIWLIGLTQFTGGQVPNGASKPITLNWADVSEKLKANDVKGLAKLFDDHPELVRAVPARLTKPDFTSGFTLLHIAVEEGALDVARELLKRGADINARAAGRYGNGYTPLHVAAFYSPAATVEFLLDHGADKTLVTPSGATALQLAILSNYDGATALQPALSRNKTESAKLLLSKGLPWDALSASGMGNLDYLKQAFAQDRAILAVKGEKKYTPLHFAALNGQLEVARWLISQGADVNAEDEQGWSGHGETPLHIAVGHGPLQLVEFLIESKADIEAPGWNFPPLHIAAQSGNVAIAKALLKAGADVNSRTWCDGRTPLHEAAMGDNVEIVQVLLDANSDVNAVENQSRGVNARGSPSYETPLDNAYSVYGAQDWEFGDKKAREKVFALLIAHGGKRGKDLKKQAPNKAGRRPQ